MTNTIKLSIEGMSCGHCVKRVTNALSEVSGVSDVKVDLAGKSATVTGTPEVETLKAAVDEAGYDVVGVTALQAEEAEEAAQEKGHIVRKPAAL